MLSKEEPIESEIGNDDEEYGEEEAHGGDKKNSTYKYSAQQPTYSTTKNFNNRAASYLAKGGTVW